MEFSKRYKFSKWPNSDIPKISAGIYAIWKSDELLYCGMSGRQIENHKSDRKFGLIARLNSHASGRLSGDQFCVYVANRLVIPSLRADDLPKFASGELKLDTMTKLYIHEHLDYQYILVDSSSEAYTAEVNARNGSLLGQKPLLNPL
jgi:hypothetical protein